MKQTKAKKKKGSTASGSGPSFKKRKISASAISKWTKLPSAGKSLVSWLLEDATERFNGLEDEEVDTTLDIIKKRIQNSLQNMRVPEDGVYDIGAIESKKALLATELDALNNQEEVLKRKLDRCTRSMAQMEKEMEKLKSNTSDKT